MNEQEMFKWEEHAKQRAITDEDPNIVEMPLATWSGILRALDPAPQPFTPFTIRQKTETIDISRDLVMALIDHIEDGEPEGDPDTGIPEGPLSELDDLKLSLVGEVKCANCGGDGTGEVIEHKVLHENAPATDYEILPCPDCGGKAIMTLAEWKAYHNK